MYIIGKFKKYIFKSDKGYIVGLFKVKASDIESFINHTITFTGYFPELNENDSYKFEGLVVNHERYGEQFNVTSFSVIPPSDEEALVEFLSSDLFKGIGEKKAKKIIDALGLDAINIILNNPNELLLVPTITTKQKDEISETLRNYQDSYQIIVELQSLGFNTKDSIAIFNFYRDKALDVIKCNPYKLIDDINEISFKKIDVLRSKFNIKDNDLIRIEACIKYVMSEYSNICGDTYLQKQQIINLVNRAIRINDYDLISSCIDDLTITSELIRIEEKYFLSRIYNNELYIATRLVNMSRIYEEDKNIDLELEILENGYGISFNSDQKTAIINSLKHKFSIITGGPGVGKTTIIKALVDLYQNVNHLSYENLLKDVALLAPTGRASKRISEQTYLPSYTIHRFLKWNREDNTFLVNDTNKSEAKLIIVDEASMVDTFILESLLRGISINSRLILVGDNDQLPSVGPGQVLKDLIDSNKFSVFRLNKLYRQEETSQIVDLAYQINNNLFDKSILSINKDIVFKESNELNLKDDLKEIIENENISDYTSFQLLAPLYKGVNGIDDLNLFLQNIFNKKDKNKEEFIHGEVVFRENDKVLQLVNMPDENVFNGDIGYIDKINKNRDLFINFDDNKVRYQMSSMDDIRLAYAISIHKSQGSEFDTVILPVLNKYHIMLYKKLIYTAITRAKRKLIIVGELSALEKAIKTNKENSRKTNLKNLIIDRIS